MPFRYNECNFHLQGYIAGELVRMKRAGALGNVWIDSDRIRVTRPGEQEWQRRQIAWTTAAVMIRKFQQEEIHERESKELARLPGTIMPESQAARIGEAMRGVRKRKAESEHYAALRRAEEIAKLPIQNTCRILVAGGQITAAGKLAGVLKRHLKTKEPYPDTTIPLRVLKREQATDRGYGF